MRTYKQKIEQITIIRDYLKTKLLTLTGFNNVLLTYGDIVNCTDFPFLVVLYMGGEREAVRELGNDVLHYDILLIDRIENELTVLENTKTIAEFFEDYQLGGNCTKCTPSVPQIYYDEINGVKNVQCVITLDIEI